MEQIKYTPKNRKGKHLNHEERVKIETLFQEGFSAAQIGEKVGCRNRRTIEQEIARGMVELLND